MPPEAELPKRIARCIGIWETNRGGTEPIPRESALDTVAGIHASMATIEQATMSYAVDAFAAYKSLRDGASPPLAAAEISSANACCKAVKRLLAGVNAAVGRAVPLADFVRDNADLLEETCLAEADVDTMYAAVHFKARIDSLRSEVRRGRLTLDRAVASIPAADRMGLGRGSLKAYIRKARNWGEHRAGWQRKAVLAMTDGIGHRVEDVATSEDGTALAIPVIAGRVHALLRKRPKRSEFAVVSTVAQENNPGEASYGANVLAIYKMLYSGKKIEVLLASALLARIAKALSEEEAVYLMMLLTARFETYPHRAPHPA